MRRWKPSRRDVLRGLGTLAGASVLNLWGCNGEGPSNGNGPSDGDPNGDGSPPTNGPSPGLVVRHDVMSDEGQAMLESYRKGVRALKEATGSVTWRSQANIHLDWCPHGNAYFLPWHRAYLHYFEAIIRDAAEDPSFALPYWDWSTHPKIPPAFFEGDLNDPTRSRGPNDEVPSQYVSPEVIQGILEIPDFQTFASAYVGPPNTCFPSPDGKEQRQRCGSGELEGTPHNNVHNWVGGNMQTFLSPLDPIFWLHHCNVDRLWAEWNLDHANGTNATWRNFEFVDNFVDAAGQPQSIRVAQTFATPSLGYRYDTIPEAGPEAAPEAADTTVLAAVEAANTAVARPGEKIRVPVEITDELRQALPGAPGLESAGIRAVRLTVGGVDHPETPVPVNVYVGAADAPTGGMESAAYVGVFNFFPTGEGAHGGKTSFLFDATELVGGLASEDQIHVHVEALESEGPQPEAAQPSISPATIRLEVVGQG